MQCLVPSLRLAQDEERRRQENLARERLAAARSRKQTQDDNDEVKVDLDDPSSLQLAISHTLDKQHERERQTLIKVCTEFHGLKLLNTYVGL